LPGGDPSRPVAGRARRGRHALGAGTLLTSGDAIEQLLENVFRCV
jgi:hypothetical protein